MFGDPDGIDLGQQGGVAFATVFLLDYLKRASWFPWISNETETLNRALSLIVAFCTAAGLKIASSGTTHGPGSLTIAWGSSLWVVLGHAGSQFLAQEGAHKFLAAHKMLKTVLLYIGQQQSPPINLLK